MFSFVGLSLKDKLKLYIKDDIDNTISVASKSDVLFASKNGLSINGIAYDSSTDKIELLQDYFDVNITELSDSECDTIGKIIDNIGSHLSLEDVDYSMFKDNDTGELLSLTTGFNLLKKEVTENGSLSVDFDESDKKNLETIKNRFRVDFLEENQLGNLGINLDIDSFDEYTDLDGDTEEEQTDKQTDEQEVEESTEEESTEEETKVSKLYNLLEANQNAILRRYYLWFSQRIFEQAGLNGKNTKIHMNTTRMKAKRASLAKLKKTGGTWAYAGFIDARYRGGAHCSFGHALRYMHIAWDVEKSDIESAFFGDRYDKDIETILNSNENNAIVFGIDCVGDFFDIDSSYRGLLQKTQRDTLKDMERMYDYYDAGLDSEVNNSFDIMDDFMKYVKSSSAKRVLMGKSTVIDAGTTQFYLQCRESGLVPPKSLVQLVRNSIVGWDTSKFTRSNSYYYNYKYRNYKEIQGDLNVDFFLEVMNAIFGNQFNDLICLAYSKLYDRSDIPVNYKEKENVIDCLKDYFDTYFMYKICGYYEYKADNDSKDEGGASRNARVELNQRYYNIKHYLWSDVEYSVAYMKKMKEFYDMSTQINKDDLKCVYNIVLDSATNRYKIDFNSLEFSPSLINTYSTENDSRLYDSLSLVLPSFSYMSRRGDYSNFTIDAMIVSYKEALAIINDEKETFKTWQLEKLQKTCAEKNELLEQEEEMRKAQEEIRLRQEQTRKLEAQNRIEELKTKPVKKLSRSEIMEVLDASDLSSFDENGIHMQVYTTAKSNGHYDRLSSRQMYRIEQMFNMLYHNEPEDTAIQQTQTTVVTADKIALKDNEDIREALKYAIKNKAKFVGKNNINDFDFKIVATVLNYESASSKQMKYIQPIVDLYKSMQV